MRTMLVSGAVGAFLLLALGGCEGDSGTDGAGPGVQAVGDAAGEPPALPVDAGVDAPAPDVAVETAAPCANECGPIESRECRGAAAYAVCRPIGGCLRWDTQVNCAAGEACRQGVCEITPTCDPTRACDTPDARRCEDRDVVVCREDGDCRGWVVEETCGAPFECRAGACEPPAGDPCESLQTCRDTHCSEPANPDSMVEVHYCTLKTCRADFEACFGALGTGTCKEALQCVGSCQTDGCFVSCLAPTSYEANLDLMELTMCMEDNCPDALTGDPTQHIGCFTGPCGDPLVACCGSLMGCL